MYWTMRDLELLDGVKFGGGGEGFGGRGGGVGRGSEGFLMVGGGGVTCTNGCGSEGFLMVGGATEAPSTLVRPAVRPPLGDDKRLGAGAEASSWSRFGATEKPRRRAAPPKKPAWWAQIPPTTPRLTTRTPSTMPIPHQCAIPHRAGGSRRSGK